MLPTKKDKLSPVECEDFAEAYANMILNPSWSWMRIQIVKMISSLKDSQTTKKILKLIGFPMPDTPEWAQDFADAVEKMDRVRLIAIIRAACSDSPPTRGMADFILKTDFGALARRSLLKAARQFSAKRGAKAKATRQDYARIAMIADEVYPVCLRIVTELKSGASPSVQQFLEQLTQDFPEACKFLQAHLSKFESVLRDKRLQERGKRIESFARLVADGVAGADYGLEPRTSIERAREGKRLLGRSHR
ncbi:MAG: hypothetical protein ACYDCM_16880 [Candidatus Acidiferrales bacterium]